MACMTERTKSAPFVGGPLDGQSYHPKTKWASYLTDTGEPLATKKGDRVFSDRTNRSEVQTCYIMRVEPRRYVHSTARDVL